MSYVVLCSMNCVNLLRGAVQIDKLWLMSVVGLIPCYMSRLHTNSNCDRQGRQSEKIAGAIRV